MCQMNFFFFMCNGKPIVITKTTEVVVGRWQGNRASAAAEQLGQGVSQDDCLQAANERVCMHAASMRSQLFQVNKTQYLMLPM